MAGLTEPSGALYRRSARTKLLTAKYAKTAHTATHV
jgi:hypothetical protein